MSEPPSKEAVVAEVTRTHSRSISLDLDLPTALFLTGLVQLACRHPNVHGKNLERAEILVSTIGRLIAEESSLLAEVVKYGWIEGR